MMRTPFYGGFFSLACWSWVPLISAVLAIRWWLEP